jgi:hypothetical protein
MSSPVTPLSTGWPGVGFFEDVTGSMEASVFFLSFALGSLSQNIREREILLMTHFTSIPIFVIAAFFFFFFSFK